MLAPIARRIFDYVVLKLCKVHLNNFYSQPMATILICLYSLRSINPWFRSSWIYFLKWSFIQFLSVYDICRMVYKNLFFRKEYVLKKFILMNFSETFICQHKMYLSGILSTDRTAFEIIWHMSLRCNYMFHSNRTWLRPPPIFSWFLFLYCILVHEWVFVHCPHIAMISLNTVRTCAIPTLSLAITHWPLPLA